MKNEVCRQNDPGALVLTIILPMQNIRYVCVYNQTKLGKFEYDNKNIYLLLLFYLFLFSFHILFLLTFVLKKEITMLVFLCFHSFSATLLYTDVFVLFFVLASPLYFTFIYTILDKCFTNSFF